MNHLDEVLKTLTATRATTLRRRRVELQVVSGPDRGLRHSFDGRVRIGARPLAELVLKDPKVSGLHCEITADDEIRVRDLGSKNGTFLGGFRVVEAVVPSGESLTVGNTRLRIMPVADEVEVPLSESDQFHGLVGASAAMRALIARVERLAGVDSTVLVQGETGTGKERVAEALHLAGRRAQNPLVVVDCGAIAGTLIESELFGYERGAFTGALTRNAGAFERAHGGTVFLDEVGELPLDLQPKLLRAIESREVRRLGGERTTAFDARIIAATNRDLALEVGKGRFREDLYYRLAVVTIHVPALRERLDDVPLLAVHMLREMGVDPAACLTAESLARLTAHDWPGNVRELRNTIERAVALMEPVSIDDEGAAPPPADSARPGKIDLTVPLRVGKQRLIDQYERLYVRAMLVATGGNVSEAARRAGMDRMTIHRIISRQGLRGDGGDKDR